MGQRRQDDDPLAGVDHAADDLDARRERQRRALPGRCPRTAACRRSSARRRRRRWRPGRRPGSGVRHVVVEVQHVEGSAVGVEHARPAPAAKVRCRAMADDLDRRPQGARRRVRAVPQVAREGAQAARRRRAGRARGRPRGPARQARRRGARRPAPAGSSAAAPRATPRRSTTYEPARWLTSSGCSRAWPRRRAIRRFRPDPIPDDDLAADPVARHPRAVGVEPPAGPLPRAPRRPVGQPRRRAARARLPRRLGREGGGGRLRPGLGARPVVAEGPAGGVDAALRRPLRGGARSSCCRASSSAPGTDVTPARRCTRRARTCCSPPAPSATAACSRCGTASSRPSCGRCWPSPTTSRIAGCIPLGRPEGSHGPVRRRPLGEVVFEERWGEPAPWAVDPEGTRFAGRPPR